MRILGIDPGTATTGYGVLEINGAGEYRLLEYGLVSTSKDLPHGRRLELIYSGISDVIEKHQPQVVSIERLFFATNALTAISVGQAIGVIKLAIHMHHLPVFDYTPMQVKLYVGGSGKADKAVMKRKVKQLFKIREKKGHKSHFDDTADAIAIALCHAIKISPNV
jgi:crossover junction endodeoxyribonuclease RuvC